MIKTLARYIAFGLFAILPATAHAFSPVRYVQISTNTLSQQSGAINISSAAVSSATITGISGSTVTYSSATFTGVAGSTITFSSATFAGVNGSTITYSSGTITTLNSTTIVVTTITPTGIVGTTTNNAANAGNYGYYLSSTTAGVNFPSSTHYGDCGTLPLPSGGDYDLSAMYYITSNGATWSEIEAGFGTVAGDSGTGMSFGDNAGIDNWANSSATPLVVTRAIASWRASVSGATTYYCKYEATYSAGGPPVLTRCRCSARRVR